ncbi:MAG: metalloregulator ArsR/SmtB family transcription factor [Myxococcota bacterium]
MPQANPLDRVFGAMSDSTRRGMLRRLAGGPMTIGELGRPYDISKPTVSHHVRVLQTAGLIKVTKRSRERICTLRAAPMRQAQRWLDFYADFWSGSFDRLAERARKR